MVTLRYLRFIDPADDLRISYLFEVNSVVQSVSVKFTLCKELTKKNILFGLS